MAESAAQSAFERIQQLLAGENESYGLNARDNASFSGYSESVAPHSTATASMRGQHDRTSYGTFLKQRVEAEGTADMLQDMLEPGTVDAHFDRLMPRDSSRRTSDSFPIPVAAGTPESLFSPSAHAQSRMLEREQQPGMESSGYTPVGQPWSVPPPASSSRYFQPHTENRNSSVRFVETESGRSPDGGRVNRDVEWFSSLHIHDAPINGQSAVVPFNSGVASTAQARLEEPDFLSILQRNLLAPESSKTRSSNNTNYIDIATAALSDPASAASYAGGFVSTSPEDTLAQAILAGKHSLVVQEGLEHTSRALRQLVEEEAISRSYASASSSSSGRLLVGYGKAPAAVGSASASAGSERDIAGTRALRKKIAELQRTATELRAERDLWSLLQCLTESSLLHDINEETCETKLNEKLRSLPITASIPEYLAAAYESDERVKKGAVLKEWIESSAADRVTECPVPREFEPWNDSLKRVLKKQRLSSSSSSSCSSRYGEPAEESKGREITSLHPDAQLVSVGDIFDVVGSTSKSFGTGAGGTGSGALFMLPLDGNDRLDQESLLKTLWQMLRAGEVQRAQQTAAEHRLFWLAAALRGAATHSYTSTYPSHYDDNSNAMFVEGEGFGSNGALPVISRLGNLKQPIWLRSCWKYTGKLNECSENNVLAAIGAGYTNGTNQHRPHNLSGMLEMSIFGSLCNHVKVLNNVVAVLCGHYSGNSVASSSAQASNSTGSSWADRLWVYVKAAHERDLSRIVHRYRCTKSAKSALFPGCEMSVINAERDLLELGKTELGHISLGNCLQLFNRVPPPSQTFDAASFATAAGRGDGGIGGIGVGVSEERGDGGRGGGGCASVVEAFLLRLQAAVIEGRSALSSFIDNELVYVCSLFRERAFLASMASQHRETTKSGPIRGAPAPAPAQLSDASRELLLRTCCHIVLWLKFSPPYKQPNGAADGGSRVPGFSFNALSIPAAAGSASGNLSDLVSNEVLYMAVEAYALHLIDTRQLAAVAPYAVYLSRARRIAIYVKLMQSIPIAGSSEPGGAVAGVRSATQFGTRNFGAPMSMGGLSVVDAGGGGGVQSSAWSDVLKLANTYFPQDVPEITRLVVELAGQDPYGMQQQQHQLHDLQAGAKESADAAPTIGKKYSQHNNHVKFSLPTDSLTPVAAGISTGPGALFTPTAKRRSSVRGRKPTPFLLRSTQFPGDEEEDEEDEEEGKARSSDSSRVNEYRARGTVSADKETAVAVHSPPDALHSGGARQQVISATPRPPYLPSDKQRMESLRWLFLEPAQRIEAVKQTNRLVVSFLLESFTNSSFSSSTSVMAGTHELVKLPCIRALLCEDYLPLDSESVGSALLVNARDRLDDKIKLLEDQMRQLAATAEAVAAAKREHAQTMAGTISDTAGIADENRDDDVEGGGRTAFVDGVNTYGEIDAATKLRIRAREDAVNAESYALDLAELNWEAEIGKLRLWRAFLAVLELYEEKFSTTVRDITATSARLLGDPITLMHSLARFKFPLERAAHVLTDRIVQLLRCAIGSGAGGVGVGAGGANSSMGSDGGTPGGFSGDFAGRALNTSVGSLGGRPMSVGSVSGISRAGFNEFISSFPADGYKEIFTKAENAALYSLLFTVDKFFHTVEARCSSPLFVDSAASGLEGVSTGSGGSPGFTLRQPFRTSRSGTPTRFGAANRAAAAATTAVLSLGTTAAAAAVGGGVRNTETHTAADAGDSIPLRQPAAFPSFMDSAGAGKESTTGTSSGASGTPSAVVATAAIAGGGASGGASGARAALLSEFELVSALASQAFPYPASVSTDADREDAAAAGSTGLEGEVRAQKEVEAGDDLRVARLVNRQMKRLQAALREALASEDTPAGSRTSKGSSGTRESRERTEGDLELAARSALSQCKQLLLDVAECEQVMGFVAHLLLKMYLQVCMETAGLMRSLNADAQAVQWLSRGVGLADLVASEEHALQLYSVLTRKQLESVLKGINQCALQLLRLDPHMASLE